MNAKEYIEKKINELVEIFPNIKCSYEFDKSDNTHIVEVLPNSFFNDDKQFETIEKETYSEFFKLYPAEGLYFVNSEVVMPVTNPGYVKVGINFNKIPTFSQAGLENMVQTKQPQINYSTAKSNFLLSGFIQPSFFQSEKLQDTFIESTPCDKFNTFFQNNSKLTKQVSAQPDYAMAA